MTDDGANNVKETKIRRAYLRLAEQRHPDKSGGSKESFQRLVDAYERLTSRNAYARTSVAAASGPAASFPTVDEQQEDDGEGPYYYEDYDDSNDGQRDYWYVQHYNFFQRASQTHRSSSSDEDDFDAFFENWHKARRREYARGIDKRDRRRSNDSQCDVCMFCGVNEAIRKDDALENGLNWEEYCAHPYNYKTCWGCKNSHKSVMTEKMACHRFAKKLSGRTGNDRPVFSVLKSHHKSFHHQPVVKGHEGPILNNEYYWYPDLEEKALELGWKPRRKKNNAEVPWQRKDIRNTTPS